MCYAYIYKVIQPYEIQVFIPPPHVITYFSDEKVCEEYLNNLVWNGKSKCPHCDPSVKPYVIEGGKYFKCSDKGCRRKFSKTVGTVFENSKVPLSK